MLDQSLALLLLKDPEGMTEDRLLSMYRNVKLSIQLEMSVLALWNKIFEKFLKESQKKNFKNIIKSPHYLKQFEKSSLFLLKKKASNSGEGKKGIAYMISRQPDQEES